MKTVLFPGRSAFTDVMRMNPLLAFDFDGTLAPIVARPEDAHVPLPIGRRLQQLAERCPVAIVTGRSIADVSARLSFRPHFVIGNHGAEEVDGVVDAQWSFALDELRDRIAAQAERLRSAGVHIEDKRLSIALHYRLAHDRVHALACIDQLLDGQRGAWSRIDGKCVVNLIPDRAPDKGDAVMRLVQRCGAGAAVFVGDDLNDEAVFIKAPKHWVTIRIGQDPRLTNAMFYLPGPEQVASLLQSMLDALAGRTNASACSPI